MAGVPSTPFPGGPQTGTPQAAPEAPEATTAYTFVDFERRSPMLWLAIAFAVLVIVFARCAGSFPSSALG